MRNSKFPLRTLVIGRETGPIAQLLNIYVPNTLIGAVDILGNMETRNYSDWKFSVVKQAPGYSLDRKKQKSLVDLLFELAIVMLEEKEFDQIIPLAPFHKFPDLVHQLGKVCEIPLTTQESLEKTSSDFTFIEALIALFPNFDSYYKKVNFKENSDHYRDGLIITEMKRFFITSETGDKFNKNLATEGIFIPIQEIKCAGFFSVNEFVNFLGFQELKPPDGYKFFWDDLERNSYYPDLENSICTNGISTFVQMIKQLKLFGLITIFFGIIEDQIVPFSCNVLPDENIDLWMEKVGNNLTSRLVKGKKNQNPLRVDPLFGFKIPIHSSKVAPVPTIPPDLATQRNLPGIVSYNEYPICAIYGTADTCQNVNKEILKSRNKVLQILDEFNP